MATFRMFAFIVLILSGVLGVKLAKLIPSVLGHPALGWITIPALTFKEEAMPAVGVHFSTWVHEYPEIAARTPTREERSGPNRDSSWQPACLSFEGRHNCGQSSALPTTTVDLLRRALRCWQ